MTGFRHVLLLLACGALATLVPAGTAEACGCRRVYTGYHCDPCGGAAFATRTYYAPVGSYYHQPYWESSTYYATPCCQWPITAGRPCATQPASTCVPPGTSVWGSCYFIAGAGGSYWASEGWCCRPVAPCMPRPCAAPCSHETVPHEGTNPPATDSKHEGPSTVPSLVPSPRPMPAPMPARPAVRKDETDTRGTSYQRMRVGRSGLVIVSSPSPSGSQSGNTITGVWLAQTAR